jgi:MFS transporter, DHA3 family, macrolide efflux protein
MADTATEHPNPPSMRPFFIVWSGQAVSLLGSSLVQFALVWWLTRTTNSASVLAFATLISLLPQILIGPFAGALVDRWNRRRVMIVADSVIALATLVIALLFWLNQTSVWAIYALLLVRATGSAFHWPAMQASTTLMVPGEHLGRVAGLNQALGGIAAILTPPLGALAMELLPMQGVLSIDVITALPAIGALLFVAIPQPVRAPGVPGVKPSIWADVREGWRFVVGWRGLLLVMITGVLINTLGQACGSLMPLLLLQHFKGGATELGWWQAISGIGMIVGGVVLGAWGGSKRRMLVSMSALALDGIAIAAVALSPQNGFWFATGMLFLSGLLETICIGLQGAIGQAIIPPQMQGRVFSLVTSVSRVVAPLGLLAAGPVADAYGVPFWWLLTGIVLVIIGVGSLFLKDMMRIEYPEYQPYRATPAPMVEEPIPG